MKYVEPKVEKPTEKELEEELRLVDRFDGQSGHKKSDYYEGVRAALKWALGREGHPTP